MFLPPVLADYTLRAKVGEGPFGMVYQAVHAATQTAFYLKIVHPELAGRPAFLERWLHRQRALQNWFAAPGTLLLPHEVGTDQDFAFVVLQPWPRDLRQELVLHGPWAPERAVALMRILAPALTAAHAQGWFHGNLKPSNVLLDGDRVALADLGWMQAAVEAFGPRLADEIPALATAAVVPPEVWRGQPLSARSDVYGLAQLLHEVLSGRAFDPAQWETHAALLDRWGDLAPALRAGLHPDPGHRPELEAWLAMLPSQGPKQAAADAGAGVGEPTPDTAASPTPQEPPLGETWRAPGQNMDSDTPIFPDLPTPEEAAAHAAARDAAWAEQDAQAAAAPPQRRTWLLGCGIFALIALVLVCGLVGIGFFAWRTLEPQIAARLTPQATAALPSVPQQNPQTPADVTAWRDAALQRPPDFVDDFDTPGQLPDDDTDENGVLDYNDGVYVIRARPDSYIRAGLFDDVYAGVVMQVQARLPRAQTDLGDGSFGFLCYVNATDAEKSYYTLDISEDGYAAVWRIVNGEDEAIYDWKPLPDEVRRAVQSGQWVTFTAVCANGTFALWADDVFLLTAHDPNAPLDGQVGLFANTLQEDDLLVEFDNFRLWEIAP